MAKSSLNIGRVAAECAAIFVSVVLAFAAESWRDEREEHQQAIASLTLVRAELEANLAELDRVMPTRDATLEGYIRALDVLIDDNTFPSDLPPIAYPEVTTIAYGLARDSGAVTRLPPPDVIVLARAYEALGVVRSNEDFINARNAQIRFQDGEQYISGYIYYTNRALSSEPEVADRLKAAIAILTKAEIAAAP